MRLYRKFLLFVFVCLIRGDHLGVGGPLFVEGYTASGDTQSSQQDKTATPCEKTATVDIKKYSEEKYTRKIEGSVITYEPQPGYCFNEVKDSGTTIWKTSDQNEYSKKVEADFKSKSRKVTIYIGSDGGLTKVFKKGDDDKKGEKGKKGDDDKWVEDAEASTYKGGTDTSDNSGLDCSCGPDCSCGSCCSCGTGCSWSCTWDIIWKYLFCGCFGCCGSGDECGWCGLCGLCQSRGFTGGKIGVDLDITKTKSGLFSREFDHARDGNYTTYTAKGSNAFRLVKECKTEVWKTSDESEYSTRVELDNLSFESRAITIYLAEKRTKVFIKLGRDDPWAEIDTTKVTTKPINIGYAYNSYFSALRTQGATRTYTARRGFAFNGANVYLDDKKKVEIWKTDQESEYANKIVNVGGNKVEIHLVNGSGKVYTKASPVQWKKEAYEPEFISADTEETSSLSCGWSCMWETIKGWFGSSGSPGGSPSGSPSGLPESSAATGHAGSAAQTAGGAGQPGGGTSGSSSATLPSTTPQTGGSRQPSTGTAGQSSTPAPKTGTQGTGQAKPSTSKTGVDLNLTSQEATNEFEYKKDGNYVTYTAKGDNAFKIVKDGTTKVWEATADEYSSKIEVDLMNNNARAVTIYFDDDKTMVLKNVENDLWIAIDTTKVNPCSLNINYSSETYLYKNECKNNVRTFTARSGFAFKCANEYIDGNKVEIWKTDKSDEYSKKVIADFGKNIVTIYIGSPDGGSTKVYKKGSDGKWTEDTSGQGNGTTGHTPPKTTGSGGGTPPARTGYQQQSSIPTGRTGYQQSSSPAARTGYQQQSSITTARTGYQQQSSIPTGRTGTHQPSSGQTVSTGTAARTDQTGTQPPKGGTQQPSTTPQTAGTQQQSSTPAARTGYQQPSSGQTARTGGQQQSSGQTARTGGQQQSSGQGAGGTASMTRQAGGGAAPGSRPAS